MHPIVRRALLTSISVILAACTNDGSSPPQKRVSAVDLGGFALSDSLRKEATHVWVSDKNVGFTFCEVIQIGISEATRGACGPEFDVANKNGVSIILWKTRTDWDLRPMREKPAYAKIPSNIPMIPLPNKALMDCCRDNTSDWYPLSRLHLGKPEQEIVDTTSLNWPVVSCYDKTSISWMCGVGFAVKGAFAEVSFGRKRHDFPSQSEIYALASSVDAKIRSMIVPARPLAPPVKPPFSGKAAAANVGYRHRRSRKQSVRIPPVPAVQIRTRQKLSVTDLPRPPVLPVSRSAFNR